MKTVIHTIKYFQLILLVFILGTLNTAIACGVDQHLETWNGGTSERNLPGYYEWQSFTTAASGDLCQIDLMFCNSNNILYGKGTLKIFTGTGINGTLLASQQVVVDGRAFKYNQPFWQSWLINKTVHVTNGSVYTFQFIPTIGGGLPDPYLIQVNTNNAYPGGRNSQRADWDNPFRTYVSTILPVSLLYFNAHVDAGKVILNWATSSEINHQSFSVERSNDDDNFQTLDVLATKSSEAGHSYTCTDNTPLNGNNFYRLKQTDKDGTVTYYSVIKVAINSEVPVRIYPNPVKDILHINGVVRNAEVMIMNTAGEIVSKKILSDADELNLQTLNKGTYFIRIKTSNNIYNLPFFKQ